MDFTSTVSTSTMGTCSIQKRRLRVRYNTKSTAPWATIETSDGVYLCTVERCSGEPDRKWRKRVRALQKVLEFADDEPPLPQVKE